MTDAKGPGCGGTPGKPGVRSAPYMALPSGMVSSNWRCEGCEDCEERDDD